MSCQFRLIKFTSTNLTNFYHFWMLPVKLISLYFFPCRWHHLHLTMQMETMRNCYPNNVINWRQFVRKLMPAVTLRAVKVRNPMENGTTNVEVTGLRIFKLHPDLQSAIIKHLMFESLPQNPDIWGLLSHTDSQFFFSSNNAMQSKKSSFIFYCSISCTLRAKNPWETSSCIFFFLR